MNEKFCRYLILGLFAVCVGLGVWLGLVYRNGGDTADALDATQSELDESITANAGLILELSEANRLNNGLIDEQRESSAYQRELEKELELSNIIIGELTTTTESLAGDIRRVDDIAIEYKDLIRQGNEFIENGEE